MHVTYIELVMQMFYICRCFKYAVNKKIRFQLKLKEEQIVVQVGCYAECRRYIAQRKRKISRKT